MKLHGRFEPFEGEPSIVRLTENSTLPGPVRASHALLRDGGDADPERFAASIAFEGADGENPPGTIVLPPELNYLEPGDILRLNPSRGRVRVLYRKASAHNSMLITERCNSHCLMCSQPPKKADDGFLVDEILTAIPLMSPSTPELGITGGEPTLYFDGLLSIIRAARDHLPTTPLHVLTNGRLFSYLRYAEEIARPQHHDLLLGIPLYSSVPANHDYVVQAKGAFYETVRGLMNLARVGQPVELRVVVHQATNADLPELARFITKNLPFVSQVALMGLEIMGFTRANLEALWVDPTEYQDHLQEAVQELRYAGITALVYNHQLCLLRPALWPFAVKSISDWKNTYADECSACAASDRCGGFFASAKYRKSEQIRTLTETDVAQADRLLRRSGL